jgi:hypothetical protein
MARPPGLGQPRKNDARRHCSETEPERVLPEWIFTEHIKLSANRQRRLHDIQVTSWHALSAFEFLALSRILYFWRELFWFFISCSKFNAHCAVLRLGKLGWAPSAPPGFPFAPRAGQATAVISACRCGLASASVARRPLGTARTITTREGSRPALFCLAGRESRLRHVQHIRMRYERRLDALLARRTAAGRCLSLQTGFDPVPAWIFPIHRPDRARGQRHRSRSLGRVGHARCLVPP